jgi:hypothetical protein
MEGGNRGNFIAMPTPDEKNRDRLSSLDEDDDAEYELEPPDAEVIAAEERRGREAVDATRVAIDIDEIYREADRDRGGEILDNWVRDFRAGFRFQTKHLLIATAVLAIVLTLWRLELFGTALGILVMLSVAGVYLYVMWQENKQQQEIDRRRQEMYARNRAYHDRLNRTPRPGDADLETASEPTGDRAGDKAQAARSTAAEAFRFRFSVWQLLAAMAVAGVLFGAVNILGGPANTATILGMMALIGLVVHALGFEPPQLIVLGWWLVLVLYVLLSIVAMLWGGFA